MFVETEWETLVMLILVSWGKKKKGLKTWGKNCSDRLQMFSLFTKENLTNRDNKGKKKLKTTQDKVEVGCG